MIKYLSISLTSLCVINLHVHGMRLNNQYIQNDKTSRFCSIEYVKNCCKSFNLLNENAQGSSINIQELFDCEGQENTPGHIDPQIFEVRVDDKKYIFKCAIDRGISEIEGSNIAASCLCNNWHYKTTIPKWGNLEINFCPIKHCKLINTQINGKEKQVALELMDLALGVNYDEWLEKHNLTNIPLDTLRKVAYCVGYAIGYMHNQNLCHNDLHGGNIKIYQENDCLIISIIDFESSKKINKSEDCFKDIQLAVLEDFFKTPVVKYPKINIENDGLIEKLAKEADNLFEQIMSFFDGYFSLRSDGFIGNLSYFEKLSRTWCISSMSNIDSHVKKGYTNVLQLSDYLVEHIRHIYDKFSSHLITDNEKNIQDIERNIIELILKQKTNIKTNYSLK